jgi:hypothetical protein
VGYSDLGVNLERAQEFQTIFTQNPWCYYYLTTNSFWSILFTCNIH